MKKRAHIPHNYEMSSEIRQAGPVSGAYSSGKAEQFVETNGRFCNTVEKRAKRERKESIVEYTVQCAV